MTDGKYNNREQQLQTQEQGPGQRARARRRGLRVLDDIVAMVGRVHPLADGIGRRNRDLADQLRRAVTSVGLNAAEGALARGGHRGAKLDLAMSSGREAIMALRLAGAVGLLQPETVEREADAIDRIVATLYKVAHKPKR